MLTTHPRKSLEDRLAKYGAMSLAAAAAALAPSAQAGVIIHTPTGGAPVTVPSNSSIFFNLTADGTSSADTGQRFRLMARHSTFGTSSWSTEAVVVARFGASWLGADSSYPFRLNGGMWVGPGGTFWNGFGDLAGTSASSSWGHWIGTGDQRGYLGVRFTAGGEGGTFYGWVELTVHGDLTMTLHRWAYEDVADAPIQTPLGAEVPEPASILLMALGVAGLALYRKRRAA